MSQRKAWNEAMRSAAGGSLQIPGLAPPPPNRSTRNKRREKARKAIHLSSSAHADLVTFRIDALEEAGVDVEEEDVEEEFDELEELEEITPGRKSKGGKRKRPGKGSNGSRKSEEMDKRFKPRSLASILMEESGRSDSVLEDYLNAEALPDKKSKLVAVYPSRKFCPVTGLFGVYTDPKTQIYFANLDALEHLRERPPPWLSGFGSGSSTYHDTVQSLRGKEL
mmetsp:Transcript_17039/g.32249  ORF Transcript_17039/g.32249 Transcript_17039/m.32249 type:complete len:223 (-) Transcript_17039:124-792(-)|eukprot:CAMPEP_0176504214 /NCGR_PEP_ID=MMETSP0200_2-20121128/15802_1 /TAXON_ID=947934 /ORGANISM="Chaetoceros sp., Strain GSL56" /LENGTH=222 /DNA_ID=CAMNT_0017903607 /DNA_START=75 /DNA_END=743 /DNA_ORIENTATION=-